MFTMHELLIGEFYGKLFDFNLKKLKKTYTHFLLLDYAY